MSADERIDKLIMTIELLLSIIKDISGKDYDIIQSDLDDIKNN